MTRRAFCGMGITAVAGIAFGGVIRIAGDNQDMLRPPIVVDENDFMGRCVRCYRCISSCPTGAIVPATMNDGVIAIKTPKLDFHRGSCDFCNKCVEACPTAAIKECDPADPAAGRIGYAVVQPDRCLAYDTGCDQCERSCPFGAISLDDRGRPIVDTGICNGCGVCENICPALVYRSFSGGDRRGIVIVKNEEREAALLETIDA